MTPASLSLRDDRGRFLPVNCPDPNCGGQTVSDFREAWVGGPQHPIARCDGLTHLDDDSPLFACKREHPRLP